MLRDRVFNWSRAHRWYRANGRAFSLEGAYRSPQPWHEVPICHGPGIDLFDAWEVELAWRKISATSRWCLKMHYHDAMHPVAACRLIRKYAALSLRASSWRDYLRTARAELARELGETVEAPRVIASAAAWKREGTMQPSADISP